MDVGEAIMGLFRVQIWHFSLGT